MKLFLDVKYEYKKKDILRVLQNHKEEVTYMLFFVSMNSLFFITLLYISNIDVKGHKQFNIFIAMTMMFIYIYQYIKQNHDHSEPYSDLIHFYMFFGLITFFMFVYTFVHMILLNIDPKNKVLIKFVFMMNVIINILTFGNLHYLGFRKTKKMKIDDFEDNNGDNDNNNADKNGPNVEENNKKRMLNGIITEMPNAYFTNVLQINHEIENQQNENGKESNNNNNNNQEEDEEEDDEYDDPYEDFSEDDEDED